VSGKRVAWSKDRTLEVARVENATSTRLVMGDAQGAVSALALSGSKLVWLASGTLWVAPLDAERWAPRALAAGIEAEAPLLAVGNEHAFVAGNTHCGLSRFELEPSGEPAEGTCLVTKLEPCALALGDGKVFATTADGDVLHIDAEGRQTTLLNAPGACGLAVAKGRVIVVSDSGVDSVSTSGGEPLRLFQRDDRSPRRHVGINRSRFYWLEAATLHSVRLEPSQPP
jgi:hypothetical protein